MESLSLLKNNSGSPVCTAATWVAEAGHVAAAAVLTAVQAALTHLAPLPSPASLAHARLAVKHTQLKGTV